MFLSALLSSGRPDGCGRTRGITQIAYRLIKDVFLLLSDCVLPDDPTDLDVRARWPLGIAYPLKEGVKPQKTRHTKLASSSAPATKDNEDNTASPIAQETHNKGE